MLKLTRHLKPFVWSIVLMFALLFGQAMADLALPGYMADIVNVGIQQGGVENSVPKAIRVSEFDKLAFFMSGSDQELVEEDYRLLDSQNLSSSDYEKYVKDYPELVNQPIYLLDTGDQDNIQLLPAKRLHLPGGGGDKGRDLIIML